MTEALSSYFEVYLSLLSIFCSTADYNMISGLPTGIFDRLSKLEILYLNDNELETFPASLLVGLEKLNSMCVSAR